MIDNYLNFLQEFTVSANFKNMGFGYSIMSNGIALYFQTKWRVTGSDNASIFVKDIKDINNIEPGKEFIAYFGQTWSLDWNEVLKSYVKKKGKYDGYKTTYIMDDKLGEAS